MDFVMKQELSGLQSKMILSFNDQESGGTINEINEEDELIQGDELQTSKILGSGGYLNLCISEGQESGER